jgi:hypothetical protein
MVETQSTAELHAFDLIRLRYSMIRSMVPDGAEVNRVELTKKYNQARNNDQCSV